MTSNEMHLLADKVYNYATITDTGEIVTTNSHIMKRLDKWNLQSELAYMDILRINALVIDQLKTRRGLYNEVL